MEIASGITLFLGKCEVVKNIKITLYQMKIKELSEKVIIIHYGK
jgi:hypothetical protein